jgi:CHAD domain-containing protein
MTAELEKSRAGTRSVRKIVRKELAKVLASLEGERLTDERVHDARKRIKIARAALRMMREALGKNVYSRENAALRDVARPLSQVRDSKVLLETLQKLADRFADEFNTLSVRGLRRALNRERTSLRRDVLRTSAPSKHNIQTVRKIRSRAGRWHVGRHGWSVIGRGVKRVYRSGREALSVAERDATPEGFHEWRKQVKYLRHHLEMLTPLQPAVIEKLAQEAHRLSDDLGAEHDLTVLREKARNYRDEMSSDDATRLLELIERRRRQLRARASRLGHRLYAQKPGAFANRLGRYWRKWH